MLRSRVFWESFAVGLAIFAGLVSCDAFVRIMAAPVPKQAAPKELTAEMVVGAWHYEWANYLDGVISFNADGTFGAMHQPDSTRAYCGTWKIENGNTIVIVETGYDTVSGDTWGGGTYRFAFDVKGYPTLKGKSNDSCPVQLSNPKR